MKQMVKTLELLIVFLSLVGSVGAAERPVYPVKVSDNGRYFVDQKGKPVFWLGTTQWQLFREYKLEDASTILEKTADKGFVFVQVMLMGVGDGTKPNVYGAEALDQRQSADAERGLFQERGRRAPDRPREQRDHLA